MPVTQRTRKILWTRAANRCAICRLELTKDPAHPDDREAVLGSECHIAAQSAGGPRSGGIAASQVDDYSNLILLCPSDHKLVDDQPGAYSADRLAAIKRDHERWVNETLDWRAMLSEELWARVKQEADALLSDARHAAAEDDDASAFFERLGVFSYITAEFLSAPELVLFTRADEGEMALAYKYQGGDVLMAHASQNGFRGGFSAFTEAATVEDHTDELPKRSDEKTARIERDSGIAIFLSAAASLRDLAERVDAAEAVMYIRASAEAPEFGFRFLRGKVELAAGPGGVFARAHRSFAHSQPIDISETIQLAVFAADRAVAAEHEPDRGFCALTANLVALNVCKSVSGTFPDMEPGKKRAVALMRIVRDRCFEGLLMLGVMQNLPDDPRVQEWAAEHADPEPEDGLSAVLPDACIDAVSAFTSETGKSEYEDELIEEALDGAYEIIGLILRFSDDDAMESLAHMFTALHKSWEEPTARPEILELVRAADTEE